MKKTALIAILCGLCISGAYSQESKLQTSPVGINHIQHYNIDFELKNYQLSTHSTEIINRIDFDFIESLRQVDTDVEYYSDRINQIVIIYSETRVAEIRSSINNNLNSSEND